jgi:hypothetical protein
LQQGGCTAGESSRSTRSSWRAPWALWWSSGSRDIGAPQFRSLTTTPGAPDEFVRPLAAFASALTQLMSTGCATLPSPEVMKTEVASFQLPEAPEAPEAGKAMVYVVRPSGAGGLVRFNVFPDDQEANSEMGYTRASQCIYFNVAPGDIVFIEQEMSFGVIMARNNLLKLDEVTGKYRVKTLTPGTILKAEK